MFTLTSAVIPILPSASVACLASTLTKTSVHPFACTTIAEFWQRWHISLGSFFRDYLLYVPFFGKPRKYFGLFLVWFCTGLWHGAAWNFILWGLYYGCFMLFEQKMGKKRMKKWPIVWKHVYTKLVIILGFGIFYFEDLGQLGQFFLNITGISMLANSAPLTDPMTFSSLRNNIFLILFAILVSLPVLPKIKSYFLESKTIPFMPSAASAPLRSVWCCSPS